MKTILLSEKYEAKNNPPAKINNNIDNGPAKTNRTTRTTFLKHRPRQSQSEGKKSPWQWQKL